MPHLANGKYVSQADAIRQWWPAAREVLIDTAHEYGAWITEDDLGAQVQQRTGISTNQPAPEWIGRVLGSVAADAEQRGEPRLASLCVTAERRVGDSHPGASGLLDARAREQRAAEDRLECYRAFGAELPADGGTPSVLAPVLSRPARPSRSAQPSRSRAAAAAPTPPPAVMRETTCPNCFMVVPVAATCRDCGEPLAA
ncbi:hypothetical protein [Agrococcus jenensis]|uniref:Uncharacterized protein n=1 Tax=Agrococcus jenensis TaxID=46353 RepID=A0A3N2AS95_9MICO|nr:hypothetical protein [Agrococcus jenensis]ROR65788.1 hypothetical protein EDD26_1158 [Agrococcus jenensis]